MANKDESDWNNIQPHHVTNMIMLAIVGLIVLILFFNCFYIINPGERGILVTLGNPDMNAKVEGLGLKVPMVQQMIIMDVKTQKYESESQAASKDLQIVTTKIAINYHLNPESVPSLYKEIGIDYQNRVMQPAEQESIKATTAKFTAEELITRREEVRQDMKELLIAKLQTRGIIVEDVLITNFDFSPSFNQAIEAKVTNEQNALAQKNKLEQIKYEAEQTVVSAQALATSLQLQKQQVTPELIALKQLDVQKAYIDKWDGKLPIVSSGNAMPIINVPAAIAATTTTTPAS